MRASSPLGSPHERPGDSVRDVEVADADRVRVPVRDPDHLRGRPRPDAGNCGQPSGGVGGVGAALQAVGERRGAAERVGSALFHPERVEHPVRGRSHGGCLGRQEQRLQRAGGRLPEVPHHRRVRPVGLLAGDLLLEDRAQESGKTSPVAGIRRPRCSRASRATSGCAAASSVKPVRSSRSPAIASARARTCSAPGPYPSASNSPPAGRSASVAGPSGCGWPTRRCRQPPGRTDRTG